MVKCHKQSRILSSKKLTGYTVPPYNEGRCPNYQENANSYYIVRVSLLYYGALSQRHALLPYTPFYGGGEIYEEQNALLALYSSLGP